MKTLKISASGLVLAVFFGLGSSTAMACASGSIEVKYAGKETCVKPEQFATLSPAVQATADKDDVAEAMGKDDDSADDNDDDNDDDSSDSDDNDSNDDSSNDNHSGSHESGSDDKGGDDNGGDDD